MNKIFLTLLCSMIMVYCSSIFAHSSTFLEEDEHTTSIPKGTELYRSWCERHPQKCDELAIKRKKKQDQFCQKHPKECRKLTK